MTTKSRPASQQVEAITRDLQHPSSTTPQTLSLLRAVLGLDIQGGRRAKPAATAVKQPIKQVKPSAKITGAPRRPTTKKPVQVTILEDNQPGASLLDTKWRRSLATEVFNATLKTLCSAAKSRQQQSRTSPKAQSKSSEPHLARPLEECSPNRQLKPNEEKAQAQDERQLEATVHCATTALQCLRQLETEAKGEDAIDLRLEQGALVLLDTMITLEVADQAESQLRILHEQYWKRRKATSNRAQGDQKEIAALPRLIIEVEDDRLAFRFATSIQSCWLRLAILKATQWVSRDLVEQMSPKTRGSPPWAIVEGFRLGHLDREACGIQLRTVALALTKLYTTSLEATTSNALDQACSFQLGCVALRIKAHSWKYLGHQPDLLKEFWTPVRRCIQRYGTATRSSGVKQSLQSCVISLSGTLSELGFDNTASSEVIRLLGDGAAHTSSRLGGMSLQMEELKINGSHRDLFVCLDGAAVCLEANPQEAQRIGQSLEWVRTSIDGQKILSRDSLTSLFLKIARVRKTLLSIALSAEEETVNGKANGDSLQLQLGCIRTLFCFLNLVLRCLQQSSSANSGKCKSSTVPADKAELLLPYAKTVEAALSVNQLSITQSPILSEEARLAFFRILEISELVQNGQRAFPVPNSTHAFFAGIPLRISQAFWHRYLWLTEHRRPNHDCVEVLQHSIDVVQRRNLNERQAAVIDVKYEKLAALLEETKSFSRAAEILRKGIELCLENGALNDAVEAFVLGPADGIWKNPKSSFFVLGNYLASLARVQLRCCDLGTKIAFDREDLPVIHRFVLAERQIMSVFIDSLEIPKEQLKCAIQHAWKLLSQLEHRKHQLQFTSQVLYLLERSQRWNASDFFTYEAIQCLTNTLEGKSDASSYQLTSMPKRTLSIQWTLVTGCLTEDLVTSFVANLKSYFGLQAEWSASQSNSLNVRILSSQLVALGDFAGVLGDEKTQLDVLTMLRMLQQHTSASDHDRQLTSLIQIGILHNRLDNTNDAGKAFAQAEKLLAELDDRASEKSLWALGYAEYLLNLANIAKSTEVLQKAQCSHHTVEDGSERTNTRVERDVMVCRAAYLASKIAFHQRRLGEAVSYAKQAVRLSTALWISIEKRLHEQRINSHDESSLQMITEDLSSLTLSGDQISGQHLKGARYWSTIALHRQTLRHIATLFSHLGLYQDSMYYSQQVSKVCQATAGRSLRSSSALELALLHANAGDRGQARLLLPNTSNLASSDRLVGAQIRDLLTAGEICIMLGEHRDAEVHLKHLYSLQLPWLRPRIAWVASHELHHSVTLKTKPSKVGTTKRGKQATNGVIANAPIKQAGTAAPILTTSQSEVAARAIGLENALRQFDQPPNGNSDVEPMLPSPGSWGPLATVSDALALLRQALSCFSADPTSNALAETALGMPVRYKLTRKSGQMSLLLEESTNLTPRAIKGFSAADRTRQDLNVDVLAVDGPRKLKAAFEMLQAVDAAQCSLLPSSMVTVMYKALSQITLMSSAVAMPLRYSTTAVILQSLTPKEVTRTRERHAICVENASGSLDQLQRWPLLMAWGDDHAVDSLNYELTELLQNLPQSWSIVSIGLSHDRKELLVSKIEAGASPFLMRVPLGRPDLEQNEPHEFTFEVAKAELVEIIREADASSHDERGQGEKQARSSWYAERENLDGRLKALLVNIENIWLGGFRGLLASQNVDRALLSRFGQSLSQSLDKHLPSRRKASKSTTRVDLHGHVLELFTNLPFEDSSEFEDSITDLLYFTIDILQFNGEPNAYDEIDFDAILVDILDALRAYHAIHSSGSASCSTRHTILIIDKELEAFPWESLPCMQGRPVSRMPSLGATKQRLDLIRAQSPTADSLSIPVGIGAYILNPSSDLKCTQQTFESIFTVQLPTFESLINTPPTEAQFESCLTQHPLLLYFGHGSGAQYILKRKIRALRKCAVTWLMGCSSAKMVEAGNFESYGMPNVYVHGGSAAVVGTLWDVTDRDLDRFAMRGLSLWGLIDEPAEEVGAKVKAKGKAQGRKEAKRDEDGGLQLADKWKGTIKEERRGKVALDEAVSAGRETCRLRYLNGAAVVVYGVPVVLGSLGEA